MCFPACSVKTDELYSGSWLLCTQVFLQHGASACLQPHAIAEARLVCKAWAAKLTAHVQALRLPHELWAHDPATGACSSQQAPANKGARSVLLRLLAARPPPAHASPHANQPQALQQLLSTFSQLRTLTLDCSDPHNTFHGSASDAQASETHSMPPVTAMLATCCRQLDTVVLQSPCSPLDWRTLGSMTAAGVGAPFQSLKLHNAALPPAATFAAILAPVATRLTALQLSCESLGSGQLAAVCGLSQLRLLHLSFGLAAEEAPQPLMLNALGALSRLTSLQLQYTGDARWGLAPDACMHGVTVLQPA